MLQVTSYRAVINGKWPKILIYNKECNEAGYPEELQPTEINLRKPHTHMEPVQMELGKIIADRFNQQETLCKS